MLFPEDDINIDSLELDSQKPENLTISDLNIDSQKNDACEESCAKEENNLKVGDDEKEDEELDDENDPENYCVPCMDNNYDNWDENCNQTGRES